eukprot:m.1177435 g.1177435  ORF g.1177435 m.1177435 type:complete len:151 (-) comp24524_c0_seq15:2284-2736(-)
MHSPSSVLLFALLLCLLSAPTLGTCTMFHSTQAQPGFPRSVKKNELDDWEDVPGEFPSSLSSRGSYSPPRERLGLRRRVRYSKNPSATTPSKIPAVRGAGTTHGTRDTGQNPLQDDMAWRISNKDAPFQNTRSGGKQCGCIVAHTIHVRV